MPFMKRNLPAKLDSDEEYNLYYKPLISHDGLVIRICANSYHILYEPQTEDWWYRSPNAEEDAAEVAKERATVVEKRKDRFRERFINNPEWMHGLSPEDAEQSNQQFRAWVSGKAETNEEDRNNNSNNGNDDEDEDEKQRKQQQSSSHNQTEKNKKGDQSDETKNEEGDKEDEEMTEAPDEQTAA